MPTRHRADDPFADMPVFISRTEPPEDKPRQTYQEFCEEERQHIRRLELERIARGEPDSFFRRHPFVVILAVVLAITAVSAAVGAPFRKNTPPVATGHELMSAAGFRRGEPLARPRDIAYGYTVAVIQYGRLDVGETFCPPEGMTDTVLAQVALHWIHERPDLWHEPAIRLVERSMADVYLCD